MADYKTWGQGGKLVTVTGQKAGRLYLAFRDTDPKDNSGHFDVHVKAKAAK